MLLLKKSSLIPIIIVVAIVLVALLVVLFYLVFRPLRFKKQAATVDSKFQFCHALLIGQNSQNVKRLEIISRTNLLYVDIFTNYSRRLKEIRDINDNDSIKAVNSMKDFLDDRDYKAFKEAYKKAAEVVSSYKETIDQFTKDLYEVIKPEEEARQKALEKKTHLRAIKQTYYSKESQLKMISSSFDEIFKHVEELFNKFDDFIESAQYDEANQILPEINSFLEELDYDLSVLPDLCTLVNKIIPEKIHEVTLAYDKMMEERFPIHNLFVKQTLENMNKDLEICKEKITQFETTDMSKQLEQMQKDLENIIEQFSKEREAKQIYDENISNIYKTGNDLENRFIKLKNMLPEVSEFYVIDEEHMNKIVEMQENINVISSIRRTIDTYIHSSTKQPYSMVVEKMNELKSMNNVILSKLDEFDAFIDSLKTDAENAYSFIFSTFDKAKKAGELVRLMNLEAIKQKYNLKLENILILLNQINDTLVTQPINIAKVNDLIHKVNDDSSLIDDNGEIAQDFNMMRLAESAIMYGNKYREDIPEVESLLTQAEAFFENGDFEKANTTATSILSKIKAANGK